MKFLVTGCAGYVGSRLVRLLLSQGEEVVGVDTFVHGNHQAITTLFPDPNFTFHRVDVRDASSVAALAEDCHNVIPLAAVVGAPSCDRNPGLAEQVNRDSVVELMNLLHRETFVAFPMTNSGYGARPGGEECLETDPLTPVSLYGRTKCDAEKAVLDRGNSASLRLATVFGVSDRMRFDLLVNQFTAELTQRRSLVLYQPHFRRNYVHVSDVARAFRHLCHSRDRGIFNCGLPEANLTKLELAQRVCAILGLPRNSIVLGQGEDPDHRDYLVSNDKILATGFQFRTSLDAGIREVSRLASGLTAEEVALMGNV